MSAFRDLLAQAHAAGITDIAFYVNVPRFFADEQYASWTATGVRTGATPIASEGRTGEEALRHLVERL